MSEGLRDIALYVHWPFCARVCPYCDFNVVRDRGRAAAEALAAAIGADLSGQAARLGPRRLTSIFFGGGTPSLMEPEQAAAIIEAARASFAPSPALEVTLEANPTDAESGRFAALAAAGVSRLSLGVQSLDDEALAFLGRNHDAAAARRAARAARAAFPRLSIDLIYALPGQDARSWRADLGDALELGPEHVSAYQLTIEAGTAFERAVARGRWSPSDPDLAAELYEATDETLSAAGFEAYEVSNHARSPAARSAHNLTYWRGGDWLGVGPGAHGRITDAAGERWATRAEPAHAAYVRRVAETGCGLSTRDRLTPEEAALERLMMGLRTLEGVEVAEIQALGLGASQMESLADQGLLRMEAGRLMASGRGRAVLDRLVLELAQTGQPG
ncbi:MAG: radical SAM family heme chaperone HemW [Caulobacteraceae bacterium]|nr:radical SAM family heme chaperone HemW [Caulobacteraceae bacterium]